MSQVISASQLKDIMKRSGENGCEGLCIFDVRFSLQDKEYGQTAYQSGHIPGAVYLNLDSDLSSAAKVHGGRHPLPEIEHLTRTLQNAGLNQSDRVVVYDDASNTYAGRLWWLLRYLGFKRVQILDGGLQAWQAESHPLTQTHTSLAKGDFKAKLQPERVISEADLKLSLNTHQTKILDARSPERYRGESEPIDLKAGHIPGALNRPFKDNLNAQGLLKPIDELQQEFSKLGLKPDDELIVYCGSGVSANLLSIALIESGYSEPQLYVGSWSDWSSRPENPIHIGPNP